MNDTNSNLLIHIYGIDGSTRSFVQTEPRFITETLAGLDPGRIFLPDRVTLNVDDSPIAFIPPLVTRVDLVTDRLTVWDFPFVLGAPHELTEAAFQQQLCDVRQQWRSARDESLMLLEIQMVSGLRCFLQMNVVAGVREEQIRQFFSLLRKRSLIFGLRAAGIGILNLANMVRFTVHPDPDEDARESAGGDVRSAKPNAGQRTLPVES